MPNPIQPQIVGVETVILKFSDLVTSAEFAVTVNA
jgi:hypothetical protein